MLLEPRPSRLLPAAWLLIHLVLFAALALTGVPPAVQALGAAALLLHLFTHAPTSSTTRIGEQAGAWTAPELRIGELQLGRRTRITWAWVRLELVGERESLDILWVRDQLDRATWSRLQARLRRSR